jgi:hypothetical protein
MVIIKRVYVTCTSIYFLTYEIYHIWHVRSICHRSVRKKNKKSPETLRTCTWLSVLVLFQAPEVHQPYYFMPKFTWKLIALQLKFVCALDEFKYYFLLQTVLIRCINTWIFFGYQGMKCISIKENTYRPVWSQLVPSDGVFIEFGMAEVQKGFFFAAYVGTQLH